MQIGDCSKFSITLKGDLICFNDWFLGIVQDQCSFLLLELVAVPDTKNRICLPGNPVSLCFQTHVFPQCFFDLCNC